MHKRPRKTAAQVSSLGTRRAAVFSQRGKGEMKWGGGGAHGVGILFCSYVAETALK